MKIKNIEKVSDRIKRAIKDDEKIILYGDADLDGTASVVILKESIEAIRGAVFYIYFPDRGDKEGYGLNNGALQIIKEKSGDRKILLIVMDCGITNFNETIVAKKLGIDIIIIDHHQPHKELPEADIIICPKQKDDKYPFKDFSNAGIIFKLAEEILGNSFSEFRAGFSELAALATIADMMKQESDNKEIIDEGLRSLLVTSRLGLKSFWDANLFKKEETIRDVAQKIVSLCSASEVIEHKTEIFYLLTLREKKEIDKIISRLSEKIEEKHRRILVMAEEAISQTEVGSMVFYGKDDWEVRYIGSAASKVENEINRPVFLYKHGKTTSRGAVRVPPGLNAVDMMSKSSDILISYGGHPPAAGFNIKNKNLNEFKNRLIQYYKEYEKSNNLH